MKQRHLWLLLALALLLGATPVSAQIYEFRLFDAGGLTHYIDYDVRFADRVEPIVEVAQEAIRVYDALWGGMHGTSIYMKLLDVPEFESGIPDEPGTHDAEAINLSVTVAVPDGRGGSHRIRPCYVPVSDAPEFSDIEALQFTIAHEIAHCYQITNVDPFAMEDEEGAWWIEGSAEWMATLVMTMPALYAGDRGDQFVETLSQSVLAQSYDAMFFFDSLAQDWGAAGVIDFLKTMPAGRSAQAEYLAAAPDIDGIFMRFGKRVHEGTLDYLPPITYPVFRSRVPARWELTAPAFSINLINLHVSHGRRSAPRFTLSNTAETGVRFLLDDVLLEDGAPVSMCPFESPVPMIVTRGAGLHLEVLARAQMEISRVDCEVEPVVEGSVGEPEIVPTVDAGDDTTASEPEIVPTVDAGDDTTDGEPEIVPTVDEGDDTVDEPEVPGAVPACMVGTWRMVQFGQLPGGAPPMEVTNGIGEVTLSADGSTYTEYLNFTISAPEGGGFPAMSITINGSMSGGIQVDSATGVVTSTGVTSSDLSGSATMAGTTMDFPVNDLALMGGDPGVTITLRCVDENTLEWNVSTLLSPFVFERVSEQ